MAAKMSTLEALIEPSVVALGLELWGIEMHVAGSAEHAACLY